MGVGEREGGGGDGRDGVVQLGISIRKILNRNEEEKMEKRRGQAKGRDAKWLAGCL